MHALPRTRMRDHAIRVPNNLPGFQLPWLRTCATHSPRCLALAPRHSRAMILAPPLPAHAHAPHFETLRLLHPSMPAQLSMLRRCRSRSSTFPSAPCRSSVPSHRLPMGYMVPAITCRDQTAHTCRNGRISHDGFKSRCASTGYAACGENVAYNSPPQLDSTVGDTHVRWMNSDGHRKNILSTGFTRVGYGYYVCPQSNRVYWTGFFGRL